MKRADPPKHYAGYETPVLLVNAIRDWVAKQHDALRVLGRCTVLTACNLQEVFATPDSTQVLIFHITPRPPPSANLNWNPGNAFNLDEILLFPMTVVRAIMPTTDADWKEWIEKCRSMTEEYHRV
ncbi:hypothetical protein BN946_scf185000.g9 [Trametes cinnabarina]|uniref:Uncharacterized protein n=1 Tax=Pycnoporus cinnabarinus TaxID=5643 RepID=A0A060S3Y9_PYCCI|nr:hypothetical protein BN946_scf185000.g9 [Trametes cinnabarina]